MLHEWRVNVGAARPDPNEMSDFNLLTINGKAFPGTDALVVKKGQRVRIRIGNLSAMDHHPIHLHGYQFKVTETDGGEIPLSAQLPETTVLVPVGSTRTIEFVANEARGLGHALPHDAPRDESDGARPTQHDRRQAGQTRLESSAPAAGLHDHGARRHGRHGRHANGRAQEQHPDGRRTRASTTPSRWAACSRS